MLHEPPLSCRSNQRIGIVSPLLLVASCVAVQFAGGRFFGEWAWIPTMLWFWAAIALLSLRASGGARVRARFSPAQGRVLWPALAVGAGLLSLPGFLRHWHLLSEPKLVASWLIFALINPWFEETYWRGLLLDATSTWGKLPSLLYSSVWFAASHPLIWGIHSIPLRKPEAAGALLVVGIAWGAAYQRTGSLRACVAGHSLANIFGLSALVLLNLYDPTVR